MKEKTEMATLLDDELFDYLTHLEDEIGRRISTTDKKSLQNLMHTQMREIVIAERVFLKYVNSNGTSPVLSISPNGLPSTASLNPDLEKMCELAGQEKAFMDVAGKFRRGVDRKYDEGLYVPVSEDEWRKELANRDEEKLLSHIGFAVDETEDGRFELLIREDIHLQGYDQHSKEFPVLVRKGKMIYQVMWNRLVEDTEESFYVPNTALVLQGRPIKSSEKKFDDIQRFYGFSGSDFRGIRKPWFIRWRGNSINYSEFLSAGTNARIGATEYILKAIGKSLERQVMLQGIRKNDLGQVLAFSEIPFKNAPNLVPKEEDLYRNGYENEQGYKKSEPKHQTNFDLVFTAGGDIMGKIEYVLPHNKRVYGLYGGVRHRFDKGGINLTISGKSILNEKQYHDLQKRLKRVGKK